MMGMYSIAQTPVKAALHKQGWLRDLWSLWCSNSTEVASQDAKHMHR